MKRGLRPLILIAALIVLFTAACFWAMNREEVPTFRNKSVWYWLDQFVTDDRPEHRYCEEAFRTMGTNAVPYIIKALQKKDSPAGNAFHSLLSKQRFLRLRHTRDHEWWRAATRACYALGPIASAAAPHLEEQLYKPRPHNFPHSALAAIGPEGILPLVRALTNHDAEVRDGARRKLDWEYKRTWLIQDSAMNYLTNKLNATDPGVRGHVLVALGYVAEEQERVIPLLDHFSREDPDPDVRGLALVGLFTFGLYQRDTNVSSFIRRALNDPDESVRAEAASLLSREGEIIPE